MSIWLGTALAEEATEAAGKAAPSYGQELVEKFAETPWTVWAAILVIVALGVILLTISRSGTKWNARMVAFGAISIALSFVLSCIRLFRMPQGGSVTPGSMLPIMLFSASFGVGPGLLAGLTYGVLQYLQGGWFANVWQFALDYLLAFASLGLAGLARSWRGKGGLCLAMLLAVVCRALSATLAGIFFWNTAPWASLVYNGTYLIPETVICMLLALLTGERIMKVMRTGR